MKVVCIENRTDRLPATFYVNYSISYEYFHLTLKKEYVVYGITESEGNIWYCIYNDLCSYYPLWTPHILFKTVDPRLSRYWIFNFDTERNKKIPLLHFPEWANDHYFYGELVEGDSDDKNALIFKEYKQKMDLEFPDSSIVVSAEIGDAQWLICPICIDAWKEAGTKDALVRCPKCKSFLNNPRYEENPPPFSTSTMTN